MADEIQSLQSASGESVETSDEQLGMSSGASDSNDRAVEPTSLDILLGRGKSNMNHAGNQRFQALVKASNDKYSTISAHREKTDVITELVHTVKENGARFLKRDAKGAFWVELSPKSTRSKVAHALRYRYRRQRSSSSGESRARASDVDADSDANASSTKNPDDDSKLYASSFQTTARDQRENSVSGHEEKPRCHRNDNVELHSVAEPPNLTSTQREYSVSSHTEQEPRRHGRPNDHVAYHPAAAIPQPEQDVIRGLNETFGTHSSFIGEHIAGLTQPRQQASNAITNSDFMLRSADVPFFEGLAALGQDDNMASSGNFRPLDALSETLELDGSESLATMARGSWAMDERGGEPEPAKKRDGMPHWHGHKDL